MKMLTEFIAKKHAKAHEKVPRLLCYNLSTTNKVNFSDLQLAKYVLEEELYEQFQNADSRFYAVVAVRKYIMSLALEKYSASNLIFGRTLDTFQFHHKDLYDKIKETYNIPFDDDFGGYIKIEENGVKFILIFLEEK